MDNLDIPILYINMDKSVKRNSIICSQFKKYNVKNFKKIKGVNANECKFIKSMHYKPSMEEYGCIMAHLNCYCYFLKNYSENDKVMILEDDTSFEYVKYFNKDFKTYIESIPSDFDIIQLTLILKKSQYKLIKCPEEYIEKYFYSTGAYIITKNAIKNILSKVIDLNKVMQSSKLKDSYVYNFKDIPNPVADSFIYASSIKIYSIPLLTYYPNKSTIQKHIENLKIQKESKTYIDNLWKINGKNIINTNLSTTEPKDLFKKHHQYLINLFKKNANKPLQIYLINENDDYANSFLTNFKHNIHKLTNNNKSEKNFAFFLNIFKHAIVNNYSNILILNCLDYKNDNIKVLSNINSLSNIYFLNSEYLGNDSNDNKNYVFLFFNKSFVIKKNLYSYIFNNSTILSNNSYLFNNLIKTNL